MEVMKKKMRNRSGFAAVIGAPNAGKSTLTNALVGEKVSIVTHKVQTTRFQIRGIAMLTGSDGSQAQIVLVDTPGIFSPKESDRLSKSMVHAAWTGVNDSEVILHVVDAPAYHRYLMNDGTSQDRLSVDDTIRVSNGLKRIQNKKIFLILNKIDELAHDLTLSLIEKFRFLNIYNEIFIVSALNMDGIKKLSEYVADLMPVSPFLYPVDQAADIPSRLMAAEITREKIFLRLHDELPYASTVETESWKNQKNGDIRIDQVIYVRRDSQKPIVLGKGGQTIKSIGASARNDMQDWLGKKVHLFLFVKVRDNWQNDKSHYLQTGLEYDA